jgi:hypothetical protein
LGFVFFSFCCLLVSDLIQFLDWIIESTWVLDPFFICVLVEKNTRGRDGRIDDDKSMRV